jgi:ABC-type transport system substrate-binding protein
VMHFSSPRGKTLGTMAAQSATIHDKDFIAWLNEYGEREGQAFLDHEVPSNFYGMHGTGPFIPQEINLNVGNTFIANPNYFREGLPLIDVYRNVVIKDIGSRFTALATGKIHYMGEGSWSMTPGQAEQAIRDFPDRIVINNQLNDEEIRTWPGYRQPKDEDVAEANRLMDEVFGAGERPTADCMAVTTDQSDIDACLYVIDTLKKSLDMKVSSNFMESAARSDILTSGNFDFTISSATSSTIGDPDDDLYGNYIREFLAASSKQYMEARWAEQPEVMAEVEAMIRGQSAELDPVKRKDLVRELDLKILNDVSQYVVVGWSLIFPGWRVELKGWRGYDLYSYTKYAMNERMWIADN